jgi:hypothetical protein
MRGTNAVTLILLGSLLLTGCLGPRLKRLEIRQLETQLAGMQQTEAFLRTNPALGRDYEARLFVSGNLFNRFLDGLSNYTIALQQPRGAHLTIERTQLIFWDGPPQVAITVRATDRSGRVQVNLRMRADLIMTVDSSESAIKLKLEIREVIPDVRLSIFRLRQLLFVGQLLRVAAQEYVDSLPVTTIPLQAELPIEFNPEPRTEIVLGDHAILYVNQNLPHFSLHYRYRAQQLMTLADGIHVFFRLERL